MDAAELDRLVEQIGEEILARWLAPRPQSAGQREASGLVCASCANSCDTICEHKAQEIVKAGACRVSFGEAGAVTDPSIARLIDHTLLRPEATRADILKLCREAREYNFASVCVNPYWVPLVASELAGSAVKVCTVVGFPLGATSTEAKVGETEAALRAGAQEIDMVQNIGALRGGDDRCGGRRHRAVAAAAHRAGAIVKVILETALLRRRSESRRRASWRKWPERIS